MIELKPSSFKPGKGISSSTNQFYHLYKDGKLVDRTLYSIYAFTKKDYTGLMVLNKRTISEINPSTLDSCRKTNPKYPKYRMEEDVVVVNSDGKIVLDTENAYCFNGFPIIISDYMFMYENTLYDNNGNVIQKFSSLNTIMENSKVFIIKDGSRYSSPEGKIYIYSKKGKLLVAY